MTNYQATVFSAPGCQKCRATERFLKQRGIPVTHAQIADSPEAQAKAAEEGWASLPIVKAESSDGETFWWHDLSSKDIDALGWLVNNT